MSSYIVIRSMYQLYISTMNIISEVYSVLLLPDVISVIKSEKVRLVEACRTPGESEKCIQNYNRKSLNKETT